MAPPVLEALLSLKVQLVASTVELFYAIKPKWLGEYFTKKDGYICDF